MRGGGAARRKPFWLDTSQVAIDKGVPMPGGRAGRIDWPALFAQLEPGDSFAAPAEASASVASAITAYRKATGVQLARRTVDDGIRVWRMK